MKAEEAVMEKLKPCPFCGSRETREIVKEYDHGTSTHRFRVVCSSNRGGCGASSPHCSNREEAIAAWNRRETTEGGEEG